MVLWETATGKRQAALTGHDSSVTAVASSPDGKALVPAGRDTGVKLWDVARAPGGK